MALRVVIVQHAEKVRASGDPGLTAGGRREAAATAAWLARAQHPPVAVWSSPSRRARETAAPIAAAAGVAVRVDPRLRERMNWEAGCPQEAFLGEWARSSADRDYQPRSGDSSNGAAERFLAALEDIRSAHAAGPVVVVAHGGVTTDALRTIAGERVLADRAPDLVHAGVPPCARTILRAASGGWSVERIADRSHLDRVAGGAGAPA